MTKTTKKIAALAKTRQNESAGQAASLEDAKSAIFVVGNMKVLMKLKGRHVKTLIGTE